MKLIRGTRKVRNPETAPMWRNVPKDRRQSVFRTIEYLALRGFHASTIANVAGCSEAQVYQACAKLQIRLRDYRDGRGEVAHGIIVQVKSPLVRRGNG